MTNTTITEKQIISLFDEGKDYQFIRRMSGYKDSFEPVNYGLTIYSSNGRLSRGNL